MATYRYYTTDLLTGNVLGDIPLFGTYMSKTINAAGDFNGSFKLETGVLNDNLLLACTEPAKTAIYVERDGLLIWGGIIWSRTYEAQGKTIQLQGQTFESYFDRVALTEHFIQQKVEQVEIFKRLINQVQGQAGSNIGLTFDPGWPVTTKTRTVLTPGYEFHYAQEIIGQLLEGDDTFQYTIDVRASAVKDKPNKVVQVGYPKLNSSVTDLFFDYPGTIRTFWWPESTAEGGTHFAGIGYGKGNKAPTAVVIDGTKVAAGYPSLWKVDNFNNIADKDLLTSKVRNESLMKNIPVNNPTFTLKSDTLPGFTGWNKLGAPVVVYMKDARFPNGKQISRRMIGWDLSPGGGDSTEELKFRLEDEVAA